MPLWKNLSFFKSNYYHTIIELARHDPSSVTPMRALWYNAMYQTPLEEVRCVILGQDPYPTRGHACGLAFSVFPNVSPLPPSLRNIFIEYSSDLGYPKPPNGSLLHWARNGVFLWNTVLTTEVGKPRAHHDWGWQRLTTEVIQKISIEREGPVVFLLWGKDAQEYESLIDERKHNVIKASHPSPLSAHKGFNGHRPFSRTNEILGKDNQINWRL